MICVAPAGAPIIVAPSGTGTGSNFPPFFGALFLLGLKLGQKSAISERDREWNLVQKAREERIREAAAECGKSKDWIEALVKGLL